MRAARWAASLRSSAPGALAWLIPILVIGAIYYSPKHIVSAATVVTGLAGLLVVMAAARRPDLSLLGLIVFLPFQGFVLAKLWDWGMPTAIVSHLGAWKEALALGVILAGCRSLMASGRRLDTVDKLALGFVALTALYAAFGPLIVPGSPAASNVRLLGFRETGGFALLLFGARHAPLGRDFGRRAGRTVLVVGTIVAAIGIYEALFSSAWNHFVVQTIKYTRYQVGVLHTNPPNVSDIRVYGMVGGARIVRIGSVFLNDLACGWYLILPFAVGLERAVRRTASPLVLLATTAIGAALLLTQTRSAILGALVVAVLALQPAAGRGRHWRTQVAILLAALAVLAVPAALSTGLAQRVQASGNSTDQSTAGHVGDFWTGVDTLKSNPLGLGLGTGAGTGQRFAVKNDVIAENNYLEVGDELGVIGLVLFAALTIAVVLALRRTARERFDPLITAAWAAAVGLAVSAWFLQTWSDFAVAWTFWAVAGAALGLARQRASVAEPDPSRSSAAGYSFRRAASSATL